MSIYFGLIMFVCIVPVLLICYIQIYPKDWRRKKLIFGMKNREEYKSGETADEIDALVKKHRARARGIVLVSIAFALILLLLHDMPLLTTVWISFILLAIIAINLPYLFGNREMKALKRRLGLGSEAGVSLVDLSNVGAVHALNKGRLMVPVAATVLLLIIAILGDLKLLDLFGEAADGSFMMTILMADFCFCEILIMVLTILFDNMKNEVISSDSNVNANYNRAKKKNYADTLVLILWANFIFTLGNLAAFLFFYTDLLVLIEVGLYMIFLMLAAALFVRREKKIENSYEKEMTMLEDDDDRWIAGMFYYNPADKRLNVEKRVGIGWTINMAHPVGKIFGVLLAVLMIFTLLSVVWMGMLEGTAIELQLKEGKLICHQLKDDYVIALKDIRSLELGEDLDQHKLIRTNGVGMERLLKGNFSVDGQSGCKVFLDPRENVYIRIETEDGQIYYLSAAGAEKTRNIYQEILSGVEPVR